jgi:hypothetical protein
LPKVEHAIEDAFVFVVRILQVMNKTYTALNKLLIFGNLGILRGFQLWYRPENVPVKNHIATKTIASVTGQALNATKNVNVWIVKMGNLTLT